MTIHLNNPFAINCNSTSAAQPKALYNPRRQGCTLALLLYAGFRSWINFNLLAHRFHWTLQEQNG